MNFEVFDYNDNCFIEADSKCIVACLTFWNVVFPFFFAIPFTFIGGFLAISMSNPENIQSASVNNLGAATIMSIVFLMIGLIPFAIIVINIYKNVQVKKNGTECQGTVLGYQNSNVRYNDFPGQICVMQVDTIEGKKIIHYDLKKPRRPYKVNDIITVMVYNDMYLIK